MTATTSPSSPTSPPTTSACAASTPSSSSPTSRPSSSRPCPGTASPYSTPTTSWCGPCSGAVVWFSMEPPGSKVREFIDEQCRRGGRAVVLEPTDKGDMIVIRHGRRAMQLAWTHLLPATFGGAAKMNVANALAAAGAAFAAGAPLHDIRQGLRTFTTSYYLSPGRMNLLDVQGVEVIVDYCHNPAGMRMLGDFVESYAGQKTGQADLGKSSRIGMIGAAGDRRDEDMRELGAIAADHFDVIVVREDAHLRGREKGVAAELVAEGIRARMADGARCRQV